MSVRGREDKVLDTEGEIEKEVVVRRGLSATSSRSNVVVEEWGREKSNFNS